MTTSGSCKGAVPEAGVPVVVSSRARLLGQVETHLEYPPASAIQFVRVNSQARAFELSPSGRNRVSRLVEGF